MKISILTNNYRYSDYIQKVSEESKVEAATSEKEEVNFADTLKELSELLAKRKEELDNKDKVVNPTASDFVSGAPDNLKEIFKKAADTYGVDQKLLELIGYRESRYQANATSSAGAMGIMQLMPSTAKEMGVNNAYDPEENIMGAAKLIKHLHELYNGNIDLMIAGYSAGTGAVRKYGGVPPYKETTDYIAWIKERYP